MSWPEPPDSGYGEEHRVASPLRDWRLKAAVQAVLSAVPGGARVNYALQRHVTRTLPVTDAELRTQVLKARGHLDAYTRLAGAPDARTHLYEFGAGWDLVLPLAYASWGIERQTVIDIRPLARVELIVDAARRMNAQRDVLGLQRPLPLPDHVPAKAADLLAGWGIEYHAPADARRTSLPQASVDLVTSTDVLEHVPPADIVAILAECRRIVRPDGLIRVRIDYQDHYWYFDARLTPYHFLRYDERAWRWRNPGLHYQNRLRHAELLDLVASVNLRVLEDHHPAPSDDDLRMVASVPLADRFARYSAAELAIRFANLSLRP